MGGKKAKGKHRLDKFYYLAKEQGFRARSAFKLVQLNRKYDFLSSAKATLDLCAAPGGWLQVAQKYMPMQSTIVGIDLAAIKPIRGCTTLVEDITTPSCRAAIKRVTPEGMKYDCVLHDGAPDVGATTKRRVKSGVGAGRVEIGDGVFNVRWMVCDESVSVGRVSRLVVRVSAVV